MSSTAPSYLSAALPPRPGRVPHGHLAQLDLVTKARWQLISLDELQARADEEERAWNIEFSEAWIEVEEGRRKELSKIKRFAPEIAEALGMKDPEKIDGFERWLFTQLSIQKKQLDPLIPCSAEEIEPRFENEIFDAGLDREAAKKVVAELARFANEKGTQFHKWTVDKLKSKTTSFNLKVQWRNFQNGLTPFWEIQQPRPDSRVQISDKHLQKLRKMYDLAAPNAKVELSEREEDFKLKVYCLLLRYSTLGGDAFQAAVPQYVFQYLKDKIQVEQECFASPLNCYFTEKLCSAFADIDVFFGSSGSFFDFFPEEGSFEANPPFVEAIMHKMAHHIDFLLARSSKPLSFTVIVPKWSDAASPMWNIMTNSPYLVQQAQIEKKRHEFRRGYQHSVDESNPKAAYWMAYHHTAVFFLQNEQGRKKYPITPKFIDGLVNIWSRKTFKVPRQKTGWNDRKSSPKGY